MRKSSHFEESCLLLSSESPSLKHIRNSLSMAAAIIESAVLGITCEFSVALLPIVYKLVIHVTFLQEFTLMQVLAEACVLPIIAHWSSLSLLGPYLLAACELRKKDPLDLIGGRH